MKRFILDELIKWKESKYRKPLILKGARQIGKTYILQQFGKENYEGVAYFNFDHDEDLYNLFTNTKDPKRILEQLAFIYGKAILPEKTLIIFDEIQECPNALNCENLVEYMKSIKKIENYCKDQNCYRIIVKSYNYYYPVTTNLRNFQKTVEIL